MNIKGFKDYFTGRTLEIDNLEVGELLGFKDTTDLSPFKLKPLGELGIRPDNTSNMFSYRVVSDIPKLKDRVFEINTKEKTIKRLS